MEQNTNKHPIVYEVRHNTILPKIDEALKDDSSNPVANHLLKEEIDNINDALNGKQARLTAGAHITINGSTIASDADLMPTTGFRYHHAQGDSVVFNQDQLNAMNRKPVVGDWFYTPMWDNDTSQKVRYLARYKVTAVSNTSFTATVNFLYDLWGGSDLKPKIAFSNRYAANSTVNNAVWGNDLSRQPIVGEYFVAICKERYYTLFQITAVTATNYSAKSIYEVDFGLDNEQLTNITVTDKDPGAGSALATNHLIGVTGSNILDDNAVTTRAIKNSAVTADKIDWNTIYPVGSLYLSTAATNPGTWIKGTTWQRFANGRVLVGVDENDGDFKAGATGGEKTHKLTVAELASHTHSSDHLASFSGSTNGWAGSLGTQSNFQTGSAGGDSPHNNLQPYVAVYIWRRTA